MWAASRTGRVFSSVGTAIFCSPVSHQSNLKTQLNQRSTKIQFSASRAGSFETAIIAAATCLSKGSSTGRLSHSCSRSPLETGWSVNHFFEFGSSVCLSFLSFQKNMDAADQATADWIHNNQWNVPTNWNDFWPGWRGVSGYGYHIKSF